MPVYQQCGLEFNGRVRLSDVNDCYLAAALPFAVAAATDVMKAFRRNV